MSVSTCTVSGKLVDATNTAVSGATVSAGNIYPYFYGDGTQIGNTQVSTTTAADGTWSLVLVENASTSTSTRISISYPDGSNGTLRRDYEVVVPNQMSANFADLAAGQN